MSHQFFLVEPAQNDLADIWDWYRREINPNFAQQVIDEIYDEIRLLTEFPERGAKRDELQPGLRRIQVRQYLISYRLRQDMIVVQRVLHAKSDLQTEFETEAE
jgi:toxin ParE1/3/4